MNVKHPIDGRDWTQLLADPQLVRHLDLLLKVYRDASPAHRDQALISAIRELKGKASLDASAESQPTVGQLAPVPPFDPKFFTPTRGDDRRVSPRIKCSVAVELLQENSSTPIWGNLANTSWGGCFVETALPLPPEARLEIGLWIATGKIWVKGIVLSGFVTRSSPSLGVRVEFASLVPGERETLRHFLKFVENANQGYHVENGYLAQMKR